MYISHKTTKIEDLNKIVTFPQSDKETFYLFNITKNISIDILKHFFNKRFGSTSFLVNNEVIGYANFYRYSNDPKGVIYLGNVVVSPKHRGKGYSKKIIEIMTQKAKYEFGTIELRLAVFCKNKIAYSLYQKTGFKVLKRETRKSFNQEEEPICIMYKKL